jgi:hypothetical protein
MMRLRHSMVLLNKHAMNCIKFEQNIRTWDLKTSTLWMEIDPIHCISHFLPTGTYIYLSNYLLIFLSIFPPISPPFPPSLCATAR